MPDTSGEYFNVAGLLAYTEDPDGNRTTYTYADVDGLTELTVITNPEHQTATLAYADGRVSEYTDFDGISYQFSYDSLGRLCSIAEPNPDGEGMLGGPAFTFTYDNQNRMLSMTDADGDATHFTYDFAGTLYTTGNA